MQKKEVTPEELDAAMPRPAGYQLLIALPQVSTTYGDSGIAKDAKQVHIEEVYSVVGRVMEMGPDSYKDAAKFPSGPWCKQGDWVVFKALTGARFHVYGQEVRLINDDCVLGVVDTPDGISRAY